MTNLQFIELLKRAFFEYFFTRKAGKKSSLMNLEELVELFRNQIENEVISNCKKTLKTKIDELNNDKK